MTNEFKIISEDGLKTLCKAIKKVSTVGEIIDDVNSVTDKTYSSFKIDERLNTKIDKTQLTTVLDESVTDEQIPGAKTVYNTTVDKNIKTYHLLSQLGLSSGCSVSDIFNAMSIGSIGRFDYNGSTITDIPSINGGVLLIDKCNAYRFSIEFKESAYGSVANNDMWMGQLQGSDGSRLTWTKVCTSRVADVPPTPLEVNNWATGRVVYIVVNGICYVWVSELASSTMNTNSQIIVSNLPVPKSPGLWCSIGSKDRTKGTLLVLVNGAGELLNYSGFNDTQYFGTFSYPVAE